MKNVGSPRVCYLRAHRRIWGLSQREAATLLCVSGPTVIARLEQGKYKRGPSYETALACQVLFGFAPRDMYPSIHREVEDRVIRACYRMHHGMEHVTKPSEIRKRELCEIALRRAITSRRSRRSV